MQNIGTFSLVTLNLNSATAAYICSKQFDKTRDRKKIWRILFCRRDLIVIVLKSSIVPRRTTKCVLQVHAKLYYRDKGSRRKLD